MDARPVANESISKTVISYHFTELVLEITVLEMLSLQVKRLLPVIDLLYKDSNLHD
jgi:hypothetical protein